MPTYEYACRDCGHHLEVVQSFRDAPLETCTACGGRLRKVYGAAGIIFKGSGYYVTESRKAKAKASSSSSEGESSSESGKESGEKSGKKEAAKGSDGGSSDSSTTAKSA
jgi:putative FmdB family regulatory protein